MSKYAFVTDSAVVCPNCAPKHESAFRVDVNDALPDGYTCDDCYKIVDGKEN